MPHASLITLTLITSCLLTCFFRKLSITYSWFDEANHRSAHQGSIPTAGGLAVIISIWFFSCFLLGENTEQQHSLFLILVSSTLLGLVGFIDDIRALSARSRLIAQLIIVSLSIGILIPSSKTLTIWLLLPIALIAIVWVINLTNFMDGINGLAGLQALSVLGCMGWLSYSQGNEHFAMFLWISASAFGGFLCWNFPKAHIFLGDSGSYFLGTFISLCCLFQSFEDLLWLAAWLIMMAVFIVDASLTLAVRVITKQRLVEAHSEHLYQQVARRCKSHTVPSLCILAVNTCYLFPLSLLVMNKTLPALPILTLSYLPLCLMHVWCSCKKRQNQESYSGEYLGGKS